MEILKELVCQPSLIFFPEFIHHIWWYYVCKKLFQTQTWKNDNISFSIARKLIKSIVSRQIILHIGFKTSTIVRRCLSCKLWPDCQLSVTWTWGKTQRRWIVGLMRGNWRENGSFEANFHPKQTRRYRWKR